MLVHVARAYARGTVFWGKSVNPLFTTPAYEPSMAHSPYKRGKRLKAGGNQPTITLATLDRFHRVMVCLDSHNLNYTKVTLIKKSIVCHARADSISLNTTKNFY